MIRSSSASKILDKIATHSAAADWKAGSASSDDASDSASAVLPATAADTMVSTACGSGKIDSSQQGDSRAGRGMMAPRLANSRAGKAVASDDSAPISSGESEGVAAGSAAGVASS